MKNYIIVAVAGLALMACGCKKQESSYDQYYRVEYSNKGYYSIATFFKDDKRAEPEVSLNGIVGKWGGPGFVWHGDGNPDMQFSALLNGVRVNNTVAYADAPVYDVYIPDTFSRAKGGWFVFDQATHKPDENKYFALGETTLYSSYDTPNDTVWVPIKDHLTVLDTDSVSFEFRVYKQVPLQQANGNSKGHIEVSKVYRKVVQLVP